MERIFVLIGGERERGDELNVRTERSGRHFSWLSIAV